MSEEGLPPALEVLDLDEVRSIEEERLRSHPYAVGTVADVMRANADAIPANPIAYPLDAEGVPAYFAMFLLGLYVGRKGILENARDHLPLIRTVAFWGLGLGVASMTLERLFAIVWGYDLWGPRGANIALELVADTAFAFGATLLSLGYACVITLMSGSERLRRVVKPFGPVGRMALSVYLMQTLIFTSLFYGYGLGQVGRLGPAAVNMLAVLIFGVQILACAWWVRRYRFGPVEWLWRGLTYGKAPRMRLEA